MENLQFEQNTFGKRLKTMLRVDFRRMFTMRFLYIMLGISLAIPILILVMTTMMDGTVSVNPQTGVETISEGFDNVWQIIGTVSGSTSMGMSADPSMGMDMMSMCNMDLLYFALAVLVAVFVADDFRSGYSKNLFAVRAKKSDYVISKTLVCIVGGMLMVLVFVFGAMLGGLFSGLSFAMDGFSIENVIMCVLSKILIVAVFIPIYFLMSVVAKDKLWLSLVLCFIVGMFLFMMVSMLAPLNATIINVVLCLVGGALFSVGLGAISNLVLKKTSLV